MKLPITEQFLWNLYNAVDKAGSVLPSWPLTMREALCPDWKDLRIAYDKRHNRWLFAKLVDYLKRRGYIRIKELENKKAIILTPKGVAKLQKISLKTKRGKRRKDGKWQMVIFDIPEKQRLTRNQLRRELQNLGYQGFQKSIWICSDNVLKETQDVIKRLSVERYVRLLLVEEMEIS